MRVRVDVDGGLASPGLNADPHYAEIVVGGGTSWSKANPSAAGLGTTDGGASSAAAGASFGPTIDAAAGTITIARTGAYKVNVGIGSFSTNNSNVITFEVYKNGAALSPTRKSAVIPISGQVQDAQIATILDLVKGDIVKAVVTCADTVTIQNGTFSVQQLADAELSVTT